MLKHFYTFLLVIFSVQALAGVIKGKVIDSKNNSPLIGVVVSIPGIDKGGITDIDGNYEISGLSKGNYEIVFNYATYTTINQQITLANGEIVVDIKMVPASTELKENVVKA